MAAPEGQMELAKATLQHVFAVFMLVWKFCFFCKLIFQECLLTN